MSTFSYENTPPVLRDSTVVRQFRVNTPDEFLTRLNLELNTALTVQDFLRIQVYFTNTAYRDPTIGELRLLDAITQRNRYTADRIAPGELTTRSPALAETWADMMVKHAALREGVPVSRSRGEHPLPCSLLDGLNLTGHYLHRAGLRVPEDTVMVSSPRQEAIAVAEGYEPIARVMVGADIRSLWRRCERVLDETPCRAGDMIFYVPRLTLHQARALVSAEAAKRRRAIGAIRALADRSLLSTILELCPSADLHAARLPGAGQNGFEVPYSLLCGHPSVAADGTCGYVLRVPQRSMPEATQALREQNISFFACGQARMDGNVAILLPDVNGLGEYAVISLSPDLLRAMNSPRLCAMRPEALDGPIPKAVCPAMTRLPSANREQDGLTPDGREAVALTLQDGGILTIPEADTRMTALTVGIPTADTAYSAAAEAVASAALTLESAGISPKNVRLSVSITVSHRDVLTDGPVLAAVCGVYCAAAQLTAPVEDSVVEIIPSTTLMTLTVTAWAKTAPVKAAEEGKPREDRPREDRPHEDLPHEDRQWKSSGEAVHSDSPAYFLPVLRRVYEGSLLSLIAALNRNRAVACALRPLAVNATTDPETDVTSYALHPNSHQKLLDELNRVVVPVISMNREDARLLLSHPAVADAFRRRQENGWSTLILGEACSVFAEYGLLPSALIQVHNLPVGGQAAMATYPFAEPSTRLLRADPLTPDGIAEAMETRHLLELHLPDGTVIPDGFVSEDSKTLGLLNGLDTTLLTKVQQLDFVFS